MGVTLSTGKQIEFDYGNVSRADWRNAINPKGNLDHEDTYLSKLTGLSLAEVSALSEIDFQLIFMEAIKQRREGISPNSRSAST